MPMIAETMMMTMMMMRVGWLEKDRMNRRRRLTLLAVAELAGGEIDAERLNGLWRRLLCVVYSQEACDGAAAGGLVRGSWALTVGEK